jgi:hypothetical protein
VVAFVIAVLEDGDGAEGGAVILGQEELGVGMLAKGMTPTQEGLLVHYEGRHPGLVFPIEPERKVDEAADGEAVVRAHAGDVHAVPPPAGDDARAGLARSTPLALDRWSVRPHRIMRNPGRIKP